MDRISVFGGPPKGSVGAAVGCRRRLPKRRAVVMLAIVLRTDAVIVDLLSKPASLVR
jgi:hypothetical protein